MCGILKKKKQNQICNCHKRRSRGWVNLAKMVKRYKLPVLRKISSGDVTYMITIANNTVSYI